MPRQGISRDTLQALDGYEGVQEASFVHPKANLTQAQQEAYELALKMHEAGASREEIWAATGKLGAPWWKDPNGRWWTEIADDKAKFHGKMKMIASDELGLDKHKVGEILDHPELYKHYPKMKDVPVALDSEPGWAIGNYQPGVAPGSDPHEGGAGEIRMYPENLREKLNPKYKPQDRTKTFDFEREANKKQRNLGDVFLHELGHVAQEDAGETIDEMSEYLPQLNLLRRRMNMQQRLTRPPWMEDDEVRKDYRGGLDENFNPKERR